MVLRFVKRVRAARLGDLRLGILVAAIAGCNGGSFVPPPAPELTALSDSSSQNALSVAVILSPEISAESSEWETTVRKEAGRAKVVLSIDRPAPNDPPARQAEMIREVARQRTDALLVDPMDDPEVVAAVHDARAKGKVVVLLDSRLPDRDPAAPLSRVTFVPLAEPGRRFADGLLADIRKAGLPADGHALIVTATDAGREARESAEGLGEALKSAGFTRRSRSLPTTTSPRSRHGSLFDLQLPPIPSSRPSLSRA